MVILGWGVVSHERDTPVPHNFVVGVLAASGFLAKHKTLNQEFELGAGQHTRRVAQICFLSESCLLAESGEDSIPTQRARVAVTVYYYSFDIDQDG